MSITEDDLPSNVFVDTIVHIKLDDNASYSISPTSSNHSSYAWTYVSKISEGRSSSVMDHFYQ